MVGYLSFHSSLDTETNILADSKIQKRFKNVVRIVDFILLAVNSNHYNF